MEWLDQYEIRARIAPSIVVSIPLAVVLFIDIFEISDSLVETLIGAGSVYLILTYAFSIFIRGQGYGIEQRLWNKWGGPSSVRIMRWRDHKIGDDLKQQIYNKVRDKCGIILSSKEDEKRDPNKADELISQAFLKVKAILRRCDPEGLWTKHNAEYGFQRNLLGSRGIWLSFSILGVIICLVCWTAKKDDIWVLGLAVNSFWVIGSAISGWYFLPRSTKYSADRYAESAWNSFLVCGYEAS